MIQSPLERRDIISEAEEALTEVLNLMHDNVSPTGSLKDAGEQTYAEDDYELLTEAQRVLLRLIGREHQDAIYFGEA